MRDDDEMDKMQEWQEHQHSPLYWVDKFSPLFPPKRTRGSWITSWIGLFLFLPGFLVFCWSYFADGNRESLPYVLIFGALTVIMILLTIRLRPDSRKGERQTEVEEQKRFGSLACRAASFACAWKREGLADLRSLSQGLRKVILHKI